EGSGEMGTRHSADPTATRCHGGHPQGRGRASGSRGRWASLTEDGTGPSPVTEASDCERAPLPNPPPQKQTGGAGGLKLVQIWEQHAPGLFRSQGLPLGVHRVVVVVLVVVVVVVDVVAPGFDDGTH